MITPEEEEFHAQAKELDQRESDNIELLGEVDRMRAELTEAAAELERMRELAHLRLVRLLEVDPFYQPSAPKQRERFAGEDWDDYQLRGE